MRRAAVEKPRVVLVPVPSPVVLAYDGKGWRFLPPAPEWWWEEQTEGTENEVDRLS